MLSSPLISTEIVEHLQRQGFAPYANLAAATHHQIDAVVRVLSLRAGEEFIRKEGGVRIGVLSGEVTLTGHPMPLTALGTLDQPVLSAAEKLHLTALSDSVVILADADFLDALAALDVLAQHFGQTSQALAERLTRVKHSPAFRRLPLEQVEAALTRMRSVVVRAGDEVVRQGEPGGSFYLMWSGTAEVWRQDLNDDEPVKVADLTIGDTFGEEALLTGATRNATVRMMEDGELLVLDQSDYLALMSRPMIDETTPEVAQSMLEAGWKVVDVRYWEEYEDIHIPGSLLLPLPELRRQAEEKLDSEQRYVAVCRSGKRSAVAALLLSQRGYRVVSMRGGMNAWKGATASVS